LRDADPIAALFVAGVVISVSWRLARRTVDALLDAAPSGCDRKSWMRVARRRCAGSRSSEDSSRRQSFFADLAVGLPHRTFQRSEQLASAVTEAVHKVLPDADVTVQPLPARKAQKTFLTGYGRGHAAQPQRPRHQRARSGGAPACGAACELDERMTLKDAHDRVTELEADMRRDVPEIADILLTSRASRRH